MDVLKAVNKHKKEYYIIATATTLMICMLTYLLLLALKKRKKVAEIIKQSEQRFRSIIENSYDPIILRDKNFKIIYSSPASERMLGWSKQVRSSEDTRLLIHPDDLAEIINRQDEVYANPGKPVSMIFRMKHKAGHYIWADGIMTNLLNDKNVNAIVSNIRDITDRKKAEQEIKESEAKYKAFFNNSMDGILLTEVDGKILSANPSACEIFNMSEAEMCNAERFELVDYNDPRVHKLIEKRRKTGSTQGDLTFIRKGNIKFPGEIASMVFTDATGQQRTCMIIRDITQRKKAEEKLITSNHELERFAYVASHDLQEPLRMVESFLLLLKKKYDSRLDETANKYIDFAVDGAQRMKTLTSDLLEYSRINSVIELHTPVDMDDSVSKAKKALHYIIEESGTTIIAHKLPVINGNELQLTRLLQNLFSNAIKYRSAKSPVIIIDCKEETEQWIFSVEDNGIGIPEKHFQNIFIIFKRLHGKNEYPGTGIGLAICKKIVELHNGKIWLQSIPDKGTTFYFSISKNLTPNTAGENNSKSVNQISNVNF
jgi:two-component system CheB/CheR fusion protein